LTLHDHAAAIMSETTGTGERLPTATSAPTTTTPSSAFIPTGDAVNFALFPLQTTISAVDIADENRSAPAATAEQKQIHDEGIAHINAKLDENLKPADAATLPSAPPASNPGNEDPTGGIAADAGGVSGAAHKDIPNPNTTATGATGPNAEKRKSVIGTFKGFLGLDKKSQKSTTTASDDTYVGAAAAAVTAAAATVTETVQQYTGTAAATGTTAPAEEKKDIGYQPSVAANTEPPAAAGSAVAEPAQPTDKITAEEVAESADPASKKADVENEINTDGAADKPPKEASGNPATRTNPDAIPTAGGKKVGEDTWGESEVVPEVPDVKEEGKSRDRSYNHLCLLLSILTRNNRCRRQHCCQHRLRHCSYHRREGRHLRASQGEGQVPPEAQRQVADWQGQEGRQINAACGARSYNGIIMTERSTFQRGLRAPDASGPLACMTLCLTIFDFMRMITLLCFAGFGTTREWTWFVIYVGNLMIPLCAPDFLFPVSISFTNAGFYRDQCCGLTIHSFENRRIFVSCRRRRPRGHSASNAMLELPMTLPSVGAGISLCNSWLASISSETPRISIQVLRRLHGLRA
jgi:hypothetical protein